MKPCVNCHAELVAEACFCWRCGEPQDFDLDQPISSSGDREGGDLRSQWELAEITWDVTRPGLLAGSRRCFWARAVGPDGTYVAGESDEFTAHDVMAIPDPALQSVLDTLLSGLQRDGWQPLASHGEHWYSYRFRRPARNRSDTLVRECPTSIEMDGLCAEVSTTRTPSGEWVALGSVIAAPSPVLHPAWLMVGTGSSADSAIDDLRSEMHQRADRVRQRFVTPDQHATHQAPVL